MMAMESIRGAMNVMSKKPFIPEPQPEPTNQHKCSCGCILAAHVEYKRKYKRNRATARCPRCGHGFTFNNIPQAKSGAYKLVMKVLEEATSSQGKFLEIPAEKEQVQVQLDSSSSS